MVLVIALYQSINAVDTVEYKMRVHLAAERLHLHFGHFLVEQHFCLFLFPDRIHPPFHDRIYDRGNQRQQQYAEPGGLPEGGSDDYFEGCCLSAMIVKWRMNTIRKR